MTMSTDCMSIFLACVYLLKMSRVEAPLHGLPQAPSNAAPFSRPPLPWLDLIWGSAAGKDCYGVYAAKLPDYHLGAAGNGKILWALQSRWPSPLPPQSPFRRLM